MDALEQSVSVIVRMVSWPPDSGNLVMKSMVTVSKGHVFSSGNMGDMDGWLGCILALDI